MSRLAFFFTMCAAVFLSSTTSAQSVVPPKIDLLKESTGKKIYAFSDNEVHVKGTLIKRIEFGRKTAIITYLNKSKERSRPKYRFRVLNAYGMELANFADEWVFSIDAGDTKQEEKSFVPNALDDYFEFSGVKLPEDWNKRAYLIVEGATP